MDIDESCRQVLAVDCRTCRFIVVCCTILNPVACYGKISIVPQILLDLNIFEVVLQISVLFRKNYQMISLDVVN